MYANQQRIEQHIELLSQFTATPGVGVTSSKQLYN